MYDNWLSFCTLPSVVFLVSWLLQSLATFWRFFHWFSNGEFVAKHSFASVNLLTKPMSKKFPSFSGLVNVKWREFPWFYDVTWAKQLFSRTVANQSVRYTVLVIFILLPPRGCAEFYRNLVCDKSFFVPSLLLCWDFLRFFNEFYPSNCFSSRFFYFERIFFEKSFSSCLRELVFNCV